MKNVLSLPKRHWNKHRRWYFAGIHVYNVYGGFERDGHKRTHAASDCRMDSEYYFRVDWHYFVQSGKKMRQKFIWYGKIF